MASSKLQILIEALFKDKGIKDAKKGLDDVGEAAEKSGKKMDVMSGVFMGVGQQLTDFARQGIAAMGDFAIASIKAASDAEETGAKFEAVFKDFAGGAERDLQTIADTLGRSISELKGYAATFQDTFVPLGFARDEAAKMSVALVQLAEDLGSFNNIATGDVVRDLQSALVGNTETLRKYGIVAQETQIQAKALEMGLWDGTGAIDAQAKASTILQIALDGSGDAMGNAARESDSFAGQMRTLEATTNDLKVAIGEGLIPVLNRVLPGAIKGLKGVLEGIDPTFYDTANSFAALGESIGMSSESIDFFIDRVNENVRTNADLEHATEVLLNAQILLRDGFRDNTYELYLLAEAMANAYPKFLMMERIWRKMRPEAGETAEETKRLGESIRDVGDDIKNTAPNFTNAAAGARALAAGVGELGAKAETTAPKIGAFVLALTQDLAPTVQNTVSDLLTSGAAFDTWAGKIEDATEAQRLQAEADYLGDLVSRDMITLEQAQLMWENFKKAVENPPDMNDIPAQIADVRAEFEGEPWEMTLTVKPKMETKSGGLGSMPQNMKEFLSDYAGIQADGTVIDIPVTTNAAEVQTQEIDPLKGQVEQLAANSPYNADINVTMSGYSLEDIQKLYNLLINMPPAPTGGGGGGGGGGGASTNMPSTFPGVPPSAPVGSGGGGGAMPSSSTGPAVNVTVFAPGMSPVYAGEQLARAVMSALGSSFRG